MFSESISQASSCLTHVNLVAGTTFDKVYHVVACTGVPVGIDVKCPPGVLIVGEAMVWAQVLHRDRPHGNVPRSTTEAVLSFR